MAEQFLQELRATIMSNVKLSSTATCLLACLFLFPAIVFSQTRPEPSGEAQDVVKFDTSLVQTDVMVFDKKGRFVDGLKPEQFQLKINKAQREISFFEAIRSGRFGNQPEEIQPDQPNTVAATKSDKQGRSVIFF